MTWPKKRHLCIVLTLSETMCGPFPHHQCPPPIVQCFFFLREYQRCAWKVFFLPFFSFLHGKKSRFHAQFFVFTDAFLLYNVHFFRFFIHFFYGWIFPLHGQFVDFFSRKDFFFTQKKKTLSIPPSSLLPLPRPQTVK